MSASETADLCRLTVYGPRRAVEVAVPIDLPLVDLEPELLRLAGTETAQQGVATNGWVLQRLGDAPLDELRSVAELNLRDGDALHLRPRDAQIPLADFDDVVDGVATAVRQRGDRWRPELTRSVLIGVVAVVALTALALLALPGPVPVRAATAWTLSVVQVGAAALVARFLGERGAALALGLVAVAYAAFAGGAMAGGADGTGPPLSAAAVAGAGVAMLVVLVLPSARPVFLGVVTVGVLGFVLGAVMTALRLSTVDTAALGLVLTVALGGLVPIRAVRLAGIRPRPLPNTVEQLQQDTEPEPGQDLTERAARADRYATALYAAFSAVVGTCLVTLALGGGAMVTATALCGAALVLLYSRALNGVWQRLSLLAAGLAGVVAVTVHAAAAWSPVTRLVLAGVLVAGLVAVLAAVRTLPGRRLMPVWGRIGDLALGAAAIGLVPLAGAVTGLYEWARTVAG
jgi:type VII secretion integral membrane protein EccD